jgi:hypothetical protein
VERDLRARLAAITIERLWRNAGVLLVDLFPQLAQAFAQRMQIMERI